MQHYNVCFFGNIYNGSFIYETNTHTTYLSEFLCFHVKYRIGMKIIIIYPPPLWVNICPDDDDDDDDEGEQLPSIVARPFQRKTRHSAFMEIQIFKITKSFSFH